MRTPNLGTAVYEPGNPPADPAQLQRYLLEMEIKLSAVVGMLAAGHLDKSTVAPPKPRDGDIRYANGASWNPGAGAGIYFYNGTVWAKL